MILQARHPRSHANLVEPWLEFDLRRRALRRAMIRPRKIQDHFVLALRHAGRQIRVANLNHELVLRFVPGKVWDAVNCKHINIRGLPRQQVRADLHCGQSRAGTGGERHGSRRAWCARACRG